MGVLATSIHGERSPDQGKGVDGMISNLRERVVTAKMRVMYDKVMPLSWAVG